MLAESNRGNVCVGRLESQSEPPRRVANSNDRRNLHGPPHLHAPQHEVSADQGYFHESYFEAFEYSYGYLPRTRPRQHAGNQSQ